MIGFRIDISCILYRLKELSNEDLAMKELRFLLYILVDVQMLYVTTTIVQFTKIELNDNVIARKKVENKGKDIEKNTKKLL